jgi:hypothetical protein
MKIRTTLVLTICFAALAGAFVSAPTALAQGGKGTTGPTLIKDTENPARSAVQASCTTSWLNANLGSNCELMTVPAGKRLVVEHASAYCYTQGTDFISLAFIQTQLGGESGNQLNIPLVLGGEVVAGAYKYRVASHPIRAYSDPGSSVKGLAYLNGDPTGSFQACNLSITGHLVDVQ